MVVGATVAYSALYRKGKKSILIKVGFIGGSNGICKGASNVLAANSALHWVQ